MRILCFFNAFKLIFCYKTFHNNFSGWIKNVNIQNEYFNSLCFLILISACNIPFRRKFYLLGSPVAQMFRGRTKRDTVSSFSRNFLFARWEKEGGGEQFFRCTRDN